ncbi:hypothetical protein, partial [Micromonospora sp. NPDC006431]|uniref:hypothetical protein n=1 Tax=Micromonospora sp. NPDC006431 TaxID=3364235 RepID=UPI0036CD635F
MTATRQEMACQICLAPLNTLGTPPTYVHPIQLATDGHEPVPVQRRSVRAVAGSSRVVGDDVDSGGGLVGAAVD